MSNEKKVPVKTTKLAYVDSYVKPPRNVIKKQHQHNTDIIATASPAARVASLNGISANAAKVGDTRLKVANAIRDSLPTRKFLFLTDLNKNLTQNLKYNKKGRIKGQLLFF